MASTRGNGDFLYYLLVQLKDRDRLFGQDKGFYSLTDYLEFENKEAMTALIVAAKYNNFHCFSLLIEFGSNLYVTCNRMQNTLHYAIKNENEEMIKFIIKCDMRK